MKQDEVEAVLGPPNRTFGRDEHGFWSYYASNGTKLVVRFMGDGVVGEATYEPLGGKSRPVASIESELAGRSIYKLLADRAWKTSQEEQAKKMEEFRNEHQLRPTRLPLACAAHLSATQHGHSGTRPWTPDPCQKDHSVTRGAGRSDAGRKRQDVLDRLGEPSSRYSIDGGDGIRESFTYDLASGETVVIRLADGKVVARQ